MSTYLIAPRALQDLREILDFREQYSSQAALEIFNKFEDKFQTLTRFPNLGRSRDELLQGLRSLPVEDYLIFYRLIDDGIEIARIVSGYRDLEKLFEGTEESD